MVSNTIDEISFILKQAPSLFPTNVNFYTKNNIILKIDDFVLFEAKTKNKKTSLYDQLYGNNFDLHEDIGIVIDTFIYGGDYGEDIEGYKILSLNSDIIYDTEKHYILAYVPSSIFTQKQKLTKEYIEYIENKMLIEVIQYKTNILIT